MPPEIANALTNGDPAPAGLTAAEKDACDQMNALYQTGSGYAAMMVTRPQTLGYGLADSPVGLAAWFSDKFADWTYTNREPERELTKDEMLDDISLYWLTNTATSAAKLGRAQLSQPDLLQRGRQGRPLRRVGTAGPVRRGDPRGVPVAALTGPGMTASASACVLPPAGHRVIIWCRQSTVRGQTSLT